MSLEEVRRKIDQIDPEIRELLMQRLDCSHLVAEAKQAAGSTEIYRADREAQILEQLGKTVPEDRRAGYLAVVRKVMETSRMYQYGLLYDWNQGLFETLKGSSLLQGATSGVKVRLTRPDHPNAMSSILSMIGDYGYNMEKMEQISTDSADNTATFELTIRGDLSSTNMKKLMFQLSRESMDFCILAVW